MNSTPSQVKSKEPCYRHGTLIEEKKENPKSPISRSGTKIDVRTPTRNVQPEKVVVAFKPKPQDHFLEESVEDLLDEDEKFPLYKPENKSRAEPPSTDKEPVKAFTIEQKPKETKPYIEPTPVLKEKRKLSQEDFVPQEPKKTIATVKSDKDLRSSTISDKAKPRETTPNLNEREKALSASQLSVNGSLGMYGKFLGSSSSGMTEAELVAENKLLRHFLRDLNDILNQQMDKVKIEEDDAWRKVEFKNKSPEEKIKTIVREIANNEKIMAINKEEHRKTEVRRDMIKEPTYLSNMQEQIENLYEKIDDVKSDNKKLMFSNGNVGKDLDMIENVKGVPPSIEETREKQIEMKLISKKLEVLKQKNAISAEEKKNKTEKQKTLTSEISKLEKKVEMLGPVEVGSRLSRLEYVKMMAEEALIKAKKKCKGKKILVEREIEHLALQQEREKEHVDRLDEILKEQSALLKGLMATERPRGYNRSTMDLLSDMRLSMEPGERSSGLGSANNVDDDKLEAYKVIPNRPLKTKSIERGGGRMINRDLLEAYDVKKIHQSFSKHKPMIRRELIGEKKSMWKETVDGDRARMEQILSPSPTRKNEDVIYSKPLGPKKFFGVVTPVKNSEETDSAGLKKVGALGGKGLGEPKPFAYDMKQKARHFDSKDWHDNLDEEHIVGGDTERKKQSNKKKEEEVAVTKSVKNLNVAKRKSQDDFEEKSSIDLKRNGQPDNSQTRSTISPERKVFDLKGKGNQKGKKMVQQDFEELEFDD